MELIIIPGLPNDIAHQCLFRLPFSQIHCLRYVSRAWKSEINLSELFRLRKSAAYKAQPLIILHPCYHSASYWRRKDEEEEEDEDKEEEDGEEEDEEEEHSRLLVFDPETGLSSDMPPLPDSKKLPFYCRIAVVGSKLVVMGGYDDKTKNCLDSVFIFDFYSSTWDVGTKMPDGHRSQFACAVYDNRTVFVAGGQRKRTFTSSWTYYVASNNWNQLPDMIQDSDMHDEAYRFHGLFYLDKFEVVSVKSGHWNITTQIFDISTRQWSERDSPFAWGTNLHCVEGSDQNLYNISGYELLDGNWKLVARTPTNLSGTEYDLRYLIASPGHLWLVCASDYLHPYEYDYFKMDLKKLNWIKGKVPIKFSGEIDSGYSLII